MPGIGITIPVRAAKANFRLIGTVARGQEVTITSDGQPKAVLSPISKSKPQKVFTGTWEHLKKIAPLARRPDR